MLDLDAIATKLREIVRTALAMPANSVRPANQNAPTGGKAEQFATLLIKSAPVFDVSQRIYTGQSAPSLDVTERMDVLLEVETSIQFFRGDAFNKAVRLQMLLQSGAIADLMRQNNIGLVKTGPAKNLTAVVDTYWEPRGQLDASFYVSADETASLPTFGQFPIALNVSATNPNTPSNLLTTTIKVFEP